MSNTLVETLIGAIVIAIAAVFLVYAYSTAGITRSGGSAQSRQGTGSMARVAAAVAIVAATGLGLGAYWFRIQGLPIPGHWSIDIQPPAGVQAPDCIR